MSDNIIIYSTITGLAWDGTSFGNIENAQLFSTWNKAAKAMNALKMRGLSFCSVSEYKEMASIIANY